MKKLNEEASKKVEMYYCNFNLREKFDSFYLLN